MRFWLWLTTGMVTQQWVAIHRKHHRFTETQGDPHSPHVYGIWRVLFGGAWLYNDASRDLAMVEAYGVGTPNDWLERNIYSRHSKLGITALLILETLLFHGWGIVMWLVQMAWIPFWAAGVVNGLAHFIGYRNHNTMERSTNLLPFGIVIGGEELHNNHHKSPASAKMSHRSWEFDIGWLYIRTLETLGLARVKTR
jgi:stearoyl-CoA desaturase (delta-9 desaturase)